MIAHHWLGQGDVPTGVEMTVLSAGIAGLILTVLWTIWLRLKARFKFLVALNVSGHTQAEQVIKAVNDASVATVISPSYPDIIKTAQDAQER
jgi:hypothetical protein